MKRVLVFYAMLLCLSTGLQAQIYEPEGLNMPGTWNGWQNPPAANSVFGSYTQVSGGKVTKIQTGTPRWQTTIKVAENGGGDIQGNTYEFAFTSGPPVNSYNNKWLKSSPVVFDQLQTYDRYGIGFNDFNNQITVSNGNWYVMNWQDNGYIANTQAIFMKLSAEPSNILSTSHVAVSGSDATVTVVLDKIPAAEEKIFVRYTTDNFATSTVVLATGSGTTYTATIPAASVNGDENNKYYAFTTTVSAPTGANADMVTIKNTVATRLTIGTGWHIKINAATASVSDTTAMAGQSPSATDGYDLGIDIPKPPTPVSNYVEVFFPHTGWSQVLGNNYARDIRLLKSLAESTEEWDFTVNTDRVNQDVTLTFNEFSTIPPEYDITLVDITGESSYDLRASSTFTYNSGAGGEKEFRLIIGYQPAPPQITASPTELNFGEVKVTQSKFERIVIGNSGEQDLVISQYSIQGVGFNDIGLSSMTVAPGDTIHVTVIFSPELIAPYSGSLNIISNSFESGELTIPLSGTGIQLPIIIGSSTELLNFNGVKVTQTKTETITITNSGEGVLNVTSASTSPQVFTVSSEVPFSVNPGESADVSITFAPTEVTTYSGSVTFNSNATNNSTFTVSLAGEGITLPVNITADPASLAFGSVKVTQSKTLDLSIANPAGEGNLVIETISSGNNAFTISEINLPVTIEPNGSIVLQVTFSPSEVTSYSADLTFVSNANNVQGDLTVPLSGAGTQLVPNGTISPSEIAFGNVAVGQSSYDVITISNTGGDIALTINSVSFSAAGFLLDYNGEFPVSVAPNNSVSFEVRFKPLTLSDYSAIVTFNSNNENALTASLSGTGTKITVDRDLWPGWSLISIPVNPDDASPASVFGDDFTTYFLYQYSSTGGYNVPSAVNTGYGYWFGTETEGTVDVNGTANVGVVEKSLVPGWNISATPFLNGYSASDVRFKKGDLNMSADSAQLAGWIQNVYYYYGEGSYATDTYLAPWFGYWFSVFETGVSALYDETNAEIPSDAPKTKEPVEPESDINNWAVPILASVQNVSDKLLAFGASVNATDGFDAVYDYAKPPVSPAPTALTTYFEQSGWNPYFSRFASDIRAKYEFPQSGKSWSFKVVSKTAGEVTLSWSDINTLIPEAIRNNYHFRMTGQGIPSTVDMLTTTSVTFNAEAGTVYTFAINSSLTSLGDDVNLPKEFSLGQNFPNPFNPSTTIEYNVKDAAQVTLKVYDMIGNEVATLVNEVKPAGSYTVSFDASKLSSGVYLYKMTAGSFVQTRKLVLMK